MQTPEIPIGTIVEAIVNWLRSNLSGLFDAIYSAVMSVISQVQWAFNAPPWWIMLILLVALATWAKGWRLGLFTAVGLFVVDGMRLWEPTMDTFALAIVATALAALIGVPVGILAARSSVVSSIVRPILDFMQTLPVFVYLIPAIFFFGVGLVPAVVATVIFATAPVVRLVELGIRQVDTEMVEASISFGATPNQMLRQVQLPLSLPSVMAGVNQSIMMALSMVVIAGMVGAGGLGAIVLRGISQLDIGIGFEGGLAVVFVAIYLDRVTGAFPREKKRKKKATGNADADADAGTSATEAKQLMVKTA